VDPLSRSSRHTSFRWGAGPPRQPSSLPCRNERARMAGDHNNLAERCGACMPIRNPLTSPPSRPIIFFSLHYRRCKSPPRNRGKKLVAGEALLLLRKPGWQPLLPPSNIRSEHPLSVSSLRSRAKRRKQRGEIGEAGGRGLFGPLGSAEIAEPGQGHLRDVWVLGRPPIWRGWP
jgi:hypothetical protein